MISNESSAVIVGCGGLLQHLGQHLKHADRSLWEAGRIINQLKTRYGYTTAELAPMFHQKRVRLDEIARTARDAEEAIRHPDLTFSDHLEACRAARRAAIGTRRHTGRYAAPNYKEAIQVAAAKKCGGKRFVREVAKGIIHRRREEDEPRRLAEVEKLAQQNKALLAQMMHKDWQVRYKLLHQEKQAKPLHRRMVSFVVEQWWKILIPVAVAVLIGYLKSKGVAK